MPEPTAARAAPAQTTLPTRRFQPSRAGLVTAALIYVISVAFTTPFIIGDVVTFSGEILRARAGGAPLSTLWEFGHLFWRPLGYVLAGPALAWIPAGIAPVPNLQISAALAIFSLIAGFICTLVVYDLSQRLTGNPWKAQIPVFVLVWSAAFLTYSQSGSSYIPGLGFFMAGLWVELTARGSKQRAAIVSGCLFGMAPLIWMPYLYAMPAAWCARRFISVSGKPAERTDWGWREMAIAAVTTGAIVFAGVSTGAILAGVRSPTELVQWVAAASHGMRQNRTLIRAISGFTRLAIDLRQDGVYLKRFALHDPYNPVGKFGVLLLLWKIALFYGFCGCIAALNWSSRAKRSALIPLLLAAAGGVVAAVAIFEPSSPERLLPVLPFLLISLAAGWSSPSRLRQPLQCAIAAGALLIFAINIPSFVPRLEPGYQRAIAQMSDFRRHAAPADEMVAITGAEPVIQWMVGHPFQDVRNGSAIRSYHLIDPIKTDVGRWRSVFAERTLNSWCHGREVWVEKAVQTAAPADQIMWVEGDNPAVHWKDLPAFFAAFGFNAVTPGPRGFLRLAHTPQNVELLTEWKKAGSGLPPGLEPCPESGSSGYPR